MNKLVITSLIWAFSFSLIGHFIAGKMDVYIAILIRLILALFVFIPFVERETLFSKDSLKCLGIGALQIGVMYIFYFNSFKYLNVSEVALFTILTPFYISLFGSFLQKDFSLKQAFNVFLVILGAAIIKWNKIDDHFFLGFLFIQGANVSFGLGQVLYKRILPKKSDQKKYFTLFYLGALLPIVPMILMFSDIRSIYISAAQWGVLIWLGVVASGIGYFLWNSGAKEVSYGKLAVMNNLVIPLAIIVNMLFWDKLVNWGSFLFGSIILVCGVTLEVKPSFFRASRR